MFKEKFSIAEKPNIEQKAENFFAETENSDQAIGKNPKGFVHWFDKLKNNLTNADYKKIYKNNKIRKAFILASVPFSILRAGYAQAEAKSQDTVSEFSNRPAISEIAETEKYAMIDPDRLIFLKDKIQRERIADSINMEICAFGGLSSEFNKNLRNKKGLSPDETIDFAGNMKENIETGHQDYEYARKTEKNYKMFEDGKVQYLNLAKIFGESLGAFQLSVIVHELGHNEETIKQGTTETDVDINFLGGQASYKGKIKNEAVFYSAGIKQAQKFGDFLADCLRCDKAPDQITAILALAAKSNGMLYRLKNKLLEQETDINDLVQYAKQSNISVSELALGLSAAFLGNIENWKLAGIALGKDGIKLSDSSIAPFYNLGDAGPEYGIQFKGNF